MQQQSEILITCLIIKIIQQVLQSHIQYMDTYGVALSSVWREALYTTRAHIL